MDILYSGCIILKDVCVNTHLVVLLIGASVSEPQWLDPSVHTSSYVKASHPHIEGRWCHCCIMYVYSLSKIFESYRSIETGT